MRMASTTPKKLQLRFRCLSGRFAVSRLAADAAVPSWAYAGTIGSVTRTAEELSIVCSLKNVPADVKAEAPWTGFKLEGPFPFQLTGILASFLDPLAEAGIPIFAISTYDTDYVFVKEEFADAALRALRDAGHKLIPEPNTQD